MEISTPGRICLFGEHQDYLGLPVISMAISLRVSLYGKKRRDRKIVIHKPDLRETETFSLDNLEYTHNRDYFKSGIIICQREGLSFANGFECTIKSQIPTQAGTSSSSAIVVSWINFLAQSSDIPPKWSKEKMGELAYLAESVEFRESGGIMDQYTTAFGGLLYIKPEPSASLQKIDTKLGNFVLGDSCEPKNTLYILKKCKDSRLKIFDKILSYIPSFNLHTTGSEIPLSYLNDQEQNLFNATIKNRDLLEKGLIELRKEKIDHRHFGELLNQGHQILRDKLKISTNKIDSMLSAALDAGAYGGKINGSGGGGCMFAYTPKNSEAVASAIESVGGRAYIIGKDEGTKILFKQRKNA